MSPIVALFVPAVALLAVAGLMQTPESDDWRPGCGMVWRPPGC